MGQYYKVIILADNKKNNNFIIILYINPSKYDCGSKLMEQAYIHTKLLNTVEYLISPSGKFYKSRIVWAGDYADEEKNINNNDNQDEYDEPMNLYHLAEDYSDYEISITHNMSDYKYIVNHTKKQYVDKYQNYTKGINEIHPLPLLVSEGNGQGGGDYFGNNKELCGTWSRDFISVEKEIPEDYTKLNCDFSE